MKKILLINAGGAGNLGDEIIRLVLEKLLKGTDCDVDWASFLGRGKVKGVSARRRKRVSKDWCKTIVRKAVPVELRWLLRNWRIFTRYLRASEYDLILIGGGQLIQSNSALGLAMFIWVYLFKKLHKKRVILIGVGAADRYTSFDRYLYRKSLKLADRIYVRDRGSLSVLRNVFGISCDLIPDVAFYISEMYKYHIHKKKRVLFCPANYGFYRRDNLSTGLNESEYLKYWEDHVLEYWNKGYRVKLFCTSRQQDLRITEKLKQILYDKHGIDVEILDINTLEELVKEIAKSEVIVAGRMHALIIGYCYRCKVVPFRTSEKIEAFEKEYVNSSIRLDEVQRQIVSTIKEVVSDP